MLRVHLWRKVIQLLRSVLQTYGGFVLVSPFIAVYTGLKYGHMRPGAWIPVELVTVMQEIPAWPVLMLCSALASFLDVGVWAMPGSNSSAAKPEIADEASYQLSAEMRRYLLQQESIRPDRALTVIPPWREAGAWGYLGHHRWVPSNQSARGTSTTTTHPFWKTNAATTTTTVASTAREPYPDLVGCTAWLPQSMVARHVRTGQPVEPSASRRNWEDVGFFGFTASGAGLGYIGQERLLQIYEDQVVPGFRSALWGDEYSNRYHASAFKTGGFRSRAPMAGGRGALVGAFTGSCVWLWWGQGAATMIFPSLRAEQR